MIETLKTAIRPVGAVLVKLLEGLRVLVYLGRGERPYSQVVFFLWAALVVVATWYGVVRLIAYNPAPHYAPFSLVLWDQHRSCLAEQMLRDRYGAEAVFDACVKRVYPDGPGTPVPTVRQTRNYFISKLHSETGVSLWEIWWWFENRDLGLDLSATISRLRKGFAD